MSSGSSFVLMYQFSALTFMSHICLQAVRPVASAGDKNADFSPLALFAFFVNRCRENLHIIIAFSPIGDAFRNRLRQFPSLINCCTIDWFQVRYNICMDVSATAWCPAWSDHSHWKLLHFITSSHGTLIILQVFQTHLESWDLEWPSLCMLTIQCLVLSMYVCFVVGVARWRTGEGGQQIPGACGDWGWGEGGDRQDLQVLPHQCRQPLREVSGDLAMMRAYLAVLQPVRAVLVCVKMIG